jgi:hypothetical protein
VLGPTLDPLECRIVWCGCCLFLGPNPTGGGENRVLLDERARSLPGIFCSCQILSCEISVSSPTSLASCFYGCLPVAISFLAGTSDSTTV